MPTASSGSMLIDHQPRTPLSTFVEEHGGDTVAARILMASNGLASVKGIRSMRKWAFETLGDERAVSFVVMATRDDIDGNAEFIKLADEYVEVPNGPNNLNYANVDLIISLAVRHQVHAVWAGWGHASENPRLPDGLAELTPKVVFIGPSGNSMRALGDKIASMIVAQTADVSTMAWSGSGIKMASSSARMETIDRAVYQSACCASVEEGLEAAQRIGLPVMIKASEGGGGKGIRQVDSMDQFSKLFKMVQVEVPGSPVFVMKVAENARHLEIQLICDRHGNATTLFGRDCSVQRRHQKIFEEAPITVAPPEIVEELERAAIRLARFVGYEGVGTVEYLYDAESKAYSFLELNPRLQVEHPTTEMVSGVNIPACQLMIAMGIPLHRIPYIRKLYMQDAGGADEFDLDIACRRAPIGHVVAARITAENPAEGFKPNGGKLNRIKFSSSESTWGYFSVNSDGRIHDYSDSQFGHVFSQGHDRADACKQLVESLKNTHISAEFRTNLGYVSALLQHEVFVRNAFTTSWLDGLIQAKFTPLRKDDLSVAICAATVLADKAFRMRSLAILDTLRKRQYPTKDQLSRAVFCKFIVNKTYYDFEAAQSSPESLRLSTNGRTIPVKLCQSADKLSLISFNHQTCIIQKHDSKHSLHLIIDGIDCLIEFENDPSSVRAPSSGRIVKFLVEDGSRVEKDMAIAEIEVMKMYLPVPSQGTGQISFKRQIGSSIQAGDLLASIELEDKAQCPSLARFSGDILPAAHDAPSRNCFEVFEDALQAVQLALRGFQPSNSSQAVDQLISSMADPRLVFHKIAALTAALRPKLPAKVLGSLLELIAHGLESGEQRFLGELGALTAASGDPYVEQLAQAMEPHMLGPLKFALNLLGGFLGEFVACERLFDAEPTMDGPLTKLFDMFGTDTLQIGQVVEMHSQLEARVALVLALVERLLQSFPDALKSSDLGYGNAGRSDLGYGNAGRSDLGLSDPVHSDLGKGGLGFGNLGRSDLGQLLKALASFSGKEYSLLSRRAREIMLACQLPSLDDLFHRMENKLLAALKCVEAPAKRAEFIDEMVQGFATHLDVIPRFIHHVNPVIRHLALEIYTKRVFAAYHIVEPRFTAGPGQEFFEWGFSTQPREDQDESLHRRRPSTSTVYPIAGATGSNGGDMYAKLDQQRKGYMAALDRLCGLQASIEAVLRRISLRYDEEPNHLYLVAQEVPGWGDEQTQTFIQGAIRGCAADLRLHRVRRITLALVRERIVAVGFYTYSESRDYQEDLTIRHIEPAMAYLLEFPRLCNYDIEFCYADLSGQVRIYLGTEKSKAKNRRLFVRLIVRPNQAMREFTAMVHFAPEASRILEEVLQAVEAVQAKHRQTFDSNHLFINIVPVFYNQPSDVQYVFQQLVATYKDRWTELRIRQVEVRISLAPSKDEPSCRYRFYLNNETGYVSRVYGYREKKDPVSGFKYLCSLNHGKLDGYPVTFYYPFVSQLQMRRDKVLALGTPYVYDFPNIFEHAIEHAWDRYHVLGGEVPSPAKFLEATELVLDPETGQLGATKRAPGVNTVGMVAWRFQLYTPEAPTGREIIVIANDISFEIGSFGVEEDRLFHAASVLARTEGLPRIYLSANSGARIGLAEELRNLIKVAWSNRDNPEAGFDYLYLDKDDYHSLNPSVVTCAPVRMENGDTRYQILDIIGAKHGLGVENLQGSALIAAETAIAYDEIFTLSFVTCRSVGIGAYLVRLGQRVIQKKQQPIILTGVGALNNVLGREVYQNNLQIGGPQIMFANGVSHRVVKDDLEGVQEIVQWLSFVPLSAHRPTALSLIRTRDNPLRPVTFSPTPGEPYDPRWLIEGKQADGVWLSGLFDRASFVETLGGWAKTVVTGRARLGGYPVGVIAVETRTVDMVIPADPANLNSEAQLIKQAGQVWFPDSAFKTAQAIRDFTKGESLPIFILANWRGFSGGQRDLFEQVLKFGALIVDALKDVRKPVFVYLPPGAELRGGAWVVIDSQMNPSHVEMYADPTARGGILEPEGIVGVKFRQQHLYALMDRLDPACLELGDQIEAAATPSLKDELLRKLAARRAKLLPVYRQVATQFADAHDRPGRMKAKQVIREVVPWKQSRAYFYHRLRRLMTELDLVSLVKGYRLSFGEKKARLAALLQDRFNISLLAADDEAIFDHIYEHIADIKAAIKQLNVILAKAEISRIISELSADINMDMMDLN